MNITWQADTYASKFDFVPKYGEDVLSLLDCPPGAHVIDLGCGNGNLTVKMLTKGYDVLGVEQSPEMLDKARADHPEINLLCADAVDFVAPEPVDAVFSNAVLHWIDAPRHDLLLQHVAASLKMGGQFVFECGGKGCAEAVHAALEAAFARRGMVYPRVFYFPTIGEYVPRMEKAGLVPTYAALFHRWTEVSSVEDWIRMFVREPFAGMDPLLENEIIAEASESTRGFLFQDGTWHVDYVRLRVRAIRSQATAHDVPYLP